MSLLLKKKSKKEKVDPMKLAWLILVDYYGNKTIGTVQAAREMIRKLKLSPKQLTELRYDLPDGGSGTTGSRVVGSNRMLKRLAAQGGM